VADDPDIPDLWQGARNAFYDALAAVITPDVALVRQSVDENTPLPVVLIGDLDGSPVGGKGETADKLTIDVQVTYRGPDRSGLLAIMWKVRQALDNQEIAADGVNFPTTPTWLNGDTATMDDGVTRVGIHQYEVIVEPA
jgi:hypothetical protein